MKTHGQSDTPEYRSWAAMKDRCLNPKNNAWKYYGGRSISVCKEWLSFEAFYRDMGHRAKGTQLDRINNDLGYSKDNCRWVTQKTNTRNRSNAVMLEWQGKKISLPSLADAMNINPSTLHSRLQIGWTVEEAVMGREHICRKRSLAGRAARLQRAPLIVEVEYRIERFGAMWKATPV